MHHPSLPQQAQIAIHTPAIRDSGASGPESLAVAGFAGSTAQNEAVHVRGPRGTKTSVHAALPGGFRP